MTSRSSKSGRKADFSSVRPQAGAGRFMITLRTLDAPMSIRQPQSPRLKPFTFFVSRAYRADGTERFDLNMGYFNTLADAERWAETTRRQFPSAFATLAPRASSSSVGAEDLAPLSASSHLEDTGSGALLASAAGSLTDSQVLRILEARRDPAAGDHTGASSVDQIELLHADDTMTRRVLKEAVAHDAPVWFAVQLHWSTQPIELGLVRSLPIFKAHTLYATVSRRNGRSRHFLRLGFFGDPISAKQVAVQVRAEFDAAAVVPVIEPEITRAREAKTSDAIPFLEEPSADSRRGVSGMEESSTQTSSESARRRSGARADSGDEGAAAPAEDMWAEPDLMNDSGVRHLRVERQEEMSGRWKIIRLRGDPSEEKQPQAHR
jgi:hypothetical protein